MYVVSTYDVADDPGRDGDWTEADRAPTAWALRPILRELRRRGYSRVSIAVDRIEAERCP